MVKKNLYNVVHFIDEQWLALLGIPESCECEMLNDNALGNFILIKDNEQLVFMPDGDWEIAGRVNDLPEEQRTNICKILDKHQFENPLIVNLTSSWLKIL